jgi:hypothetical protein
MSFLELNGWAVPVALGGGRKDELIGNMDRAYSGRPIKSVRAYKREFDFETIRIPEGDAAALRGIINGVGNLWKFDESIYAESGLGMQAASTGYTLEPGEAADGAAVEHFYSSSSKRDPGANTGQGALWVGNAATNDLAADRRNAENAPTGYTAGGAASLSGSTTHYWQGTKSLQVDIAAVVGGGTAYVQETGLSYPNGTKIIFSVYVKPTAVNQVVFMRGHDVTNGASSFTSYTLPSTNTWYRLIESVDVSGATCTSVQIDLADYSGSAVRFYADGFQVEGQIASGVSQPTAWVDGSRVETAISPNSYDWMDETGNYTINFWTAGQNETADYGTVALIRGEIDPRTSNLKTFELSVSGDNIRVTSGNIENGTISVTKACTTPGGFDGAWHMITVVARTIPATGEPVYSWYYDGTLYASDTTSGYVPEFCCGEITRFRIGYNSSGSRIYNGWLSDLFVLPYAMNASQISGIYSHGPMPPHPYIDASGDFCSNGNSIEVLGESEGSSYESYASSGTHLNNAQSVQFKLRER